VLFFIFGIFTSFGVKNVYIPKIKKSTFYDFWDGFGKEFVSNNKVENVKEIEQKTSAKLYSLFWQPVCKNNK